MKALRWVLAAGLLAVAAACSRQAPQPPPPAPPQPASAAPAPASAYDGAATLSFLQAVGEVRKNINSDNRNRIPALIRGQDLVMLGNEASRIAGYRESLARLPSDKVDPDALQFEKNYEAILSAYESVCTDSAELFREARQADEQNPGASQLMQQIRGGLLVSQPDAIGAAGKLVDAVRAIAASQSGYLPLTAMMQKVGDDRDKLVSSKDTHRAFALKVKADFAQRYPGVDWSAKEILPP